MWSVSGRLHMCLKKIGYDGRVSIEGKTEDMAKDAPIALAYMKGLAGE